MVGSVDEFFNLLLILSILSPYIINHRPDTCYAGPLFLASAKKFVSRLLSQTIVFFLHKLCEIYFLNAVVPEINVLVLSDHSGTSRHVWQIIIFSAVWLGDWDSSPFSLKGTAYNSPGNSSSQEVWNFLSLFFYILSSFLLFLIRFFLSGAPLVVNSYFLRSILHWRF